MINENIYQFIKDNNPTAFELVSWGTECNYSIMQLHESTEQLIREKRIIEHKVEYDYLTYSAK